MGQLLPTIRTVAAGAIAIAAGMTITANADDPPKVTPQTARLLEMRAIAEEVNIQTVVSGSASKTKRIVKPLYRFDDSARQFSDGTIWGWGESGRPFALLTLSEDKKPSAEEPRWLGELTSLSPVSLVADTKGTPVWMPAGPAITLDRFPNAPEPGATEALRLRQMKELARRFKAYEFFQPKGSNSIERYELRLLPQPIHRYADTASGIGDGALFVIAYGTNPEIILVIEAHDQKGSRPSWRFALARVAGAELHVTLDDSEVWKQPKAAFAGRGDPYYIFIRPMAAESQ